MSAIWGAISLNHTSISESLKHTMRESFRSCVIDRYEELSDQCVYMGCGIQYFTKEAVNESLPCRTGDIFFTADVVLDNRETLGSRLDIPKNQLPLIPDGELLQRMYCKYGRQCLNSLLGSYAFAYYDKNTGIASLVIDAVGNRCVYYCVFQETLYFSSLLEPLVKLTGPELNDRWITDFLAMDHLYMVSGTEETPFSNIYRISPAHCIDIDRTGIRRFRYWNPSNELEELHLENDAAYRRAFRDLYENAVRDVLRMNGPVSILLSGGLDSTSVACLASRYLMEQGENLYSYTSVPLKDYPASSRNHMDDESASVEKTASFLGNLNASFVDMPGVHAWNGRHRELAIMEMPYKSSLNMLWIPECMRLAHARGSRLMLNGFYGNSTVSYSNTQAYMSGLLMSGHLISLWREINSFQKTYGFSRKTALGNLLKNLVYTGSRGGSLPSLYGGSFVRPEMISRTQADQRLERLCRSFSQLGTNHSQARTLMFHPQALCQIGEADTKHSLATGVLLRDPTKDKRVIEFCMCLPISQFCKNGCERRLITEYMDDLMPPHILENYRRRGRQSADFAYRLSAEWESIRHQWIEEYERYSDSAYVDCHAAREQLLQRPSLSQYSVFDLTRHIYTLFVLEYEAYTRKSSGKP